MLATILYLGVWWKSHQKHHEQWSTEHWALRVCSIFQPASLGFALRMGFRSRRNSWTLQTHITHNELTVGLVNGCKRYMLISAHPFPSQTPFVIFVLGVEWRILTYHCCLQLFWASLIHNGALGQIKQQNAWPKTSTTHTHKKTSQSSGSVEKKTSVKLRSLPPRAQKKSTAGKTSRNCQDVKQYNSKSGISQSDTWEKGNVGL